MLTVCLARQCRYQNIVASTHLTPPPVFFSGGGGGGGGYEEHVLYGQLTRLSLTFAERVWLCETTQDCITEFHFQVGNGILANFHSGEQYYNLPGRTWKPLILPK